MVEQRRKHPARKGRPARGKAPRRTVRTVRPSSRWRAMRRVTPEEPSDPGRTGWLFER